MALHKLLVEHARKGGFYRTRNHIGCASGYWFTLSLKRRGTALCVESWTVPPTPERERALRESFESKKKELLLDSLRIDGGHITVTAKSSFLVSRRNAHENIDALLTTLEAMLDGAGIAPGCAWCGREGLFMPMSYAGKPLELCGSCAAEGFNRMEAHKSRRKGDYFRGAVGALAGGAAGAALWMAMAVWGAAPVLAGAAISALSAAGYKLLGGRINNVMPAIVGGVSALWVLSCNLFEILLYMKASGIKTQGGFDALAGAMSLFVSPATAGTVWASVLLGLAFAAFGARWLMGRYLAEERGEKIRLERLQRPDEKSGEN